MPDPLWRVPSEDEVKQFFFEASRETYAAATKPGTNVDFPSGKLLTHVRGAWRYADMWFSLNGKSFGQTVIWYDSVPVWGMQYQGWWKKSDDRVIPFLKRALTAAYMMGQFWGGRGPGLYEEEDCSLSYSNSAALGAFGEFEGREDIIDREVEPATVFEHWFSGVSLLNPPSPS